MKNLKGQLRKRLSDKKLNKSSIGAIAMNILNKEFKLEGELTVYLKNEIIFVNIKNGFDQTQIFLKKQELIGKINNKLEQIGYKKIITDIIVK